MVSRPPKLFLRTIIAIMVIVSFYVFALIISGGLLYFSYLSFAWGRSSILLIKIALPCVVTGCVILWSILPRVDRFSPPGPRLNKEDQPKLFEEIYSIAQKTNQTPPKEVYLIANVNAWVAERGGILGIGSRRIMGIGLPLLQAVTVSEFRAVLAHEFGHYYGGDTRLSPWIYKTRIAIGRTLQSLDGKLMHIVFQLFGNLFLRITQAISRYQEFVADEVAAKVEGPQALSLGLTKICAASHAYNAYWHSEFLPALNAGYFPPYIGGFEYFMKIDGAKNAMASTVEEELAVTLSSPYDSHPSLKERLDALDFPLEGVFDDIPASKMLKEAPALEKDLFLALGGDAGKVLKPIIWSNVGEAVYLPMWSSLVEKYQLVLDGLTLNDISDIAGAPSEFTRKIELHDNRQFPVETGYLYSRHILGAAISVRLAQHGWKISAMPGEAIKLTKHDEEFKPFKMVNDLFDKKITILDWRLMCEKIGIYEMPLGVSASFKG